MRPDVLAVLGAALVLVGAAASYRCAPGAACTRSMIAGASGSFIVGLQLFLLALFTAGYALCDGRAQLRRALMTPSSPRDVISGAGTLVAAGGLAALVATGWAPTSFAGLGQAQLLGVLLVFASTQLLFWAGALGAAVAIRRIRAEMRATAPGEVLRAGARRLRTPSGAAFVLTIGFVALTWWWLAADTRPPTNDSARHLTQAISNHAFLSMGAVLEPFRIWTDFGYPPLMHLLGAYAMLIAGGISVAVPVLTLNVLFVPMLAIGCFGAATIVFGDRRAGLLAVVFALSVPLMLSQGKVFMLDAPLAGVVALTTWLVLASDRFSHRGYTIAAGVTAGIGLMLKTAFPIYVIGLVAVVIARGGWREWRNLALIGVPALVIAAPWVALHFEDVWSKVIAHLTATSGATYRGMAFPDRWTADNFTWYWWSLVSTHLYVPLTAFLLTGVGYAAVSSVRRLGRSNYAPEILVGLASSYFFVSLLPLDDHRYLLPAVVYMAVLGAGWTVKVRPRLLRGAAIAALVTVAALNVIVQHAGMPGDRVAFRATSERIGPDGRGYFMVLFERGYTHLGVPDRAAKTPQIIAGAKDHGVEALSVSVVENPSVPILFRTVRPLAQSEGLRNDLDGLLGPGDAHITLVPPETPAPPGEPCTTWRDGTRYYLYRGDSRNLPYDRHSTWCPLDDS